MTSPSAPLSAKSLNHDPLVWVTSGPVPLASITNSSGACTEFPSTVCSTVIRGAFISLNRSTVAVAHSARSPAPNLVPKATLAGWELAPLASGARSRPAEPAQAASTPPEAEAAPPASERRVVPRDPRGAPPPDRSAPGPAPAADASARPTIAPPPALPP